MPGSFSAAFIQDIMHVIQDATSQQSPLAASTLFLQLYHTTMNDTKLITDTGRMGANATGFQIKFTNSTANFTLAGGTSPSVFQNKTVITVSTGNFSAPAQTTIQSFHIAEAVSTAAGRIIAWGDVTPNQTVSTGNTIQFSTGDLTFTLGGGTAT